MPARARAAHDVAVFHPGVQHSWQTALALQQLGRLNRYATSIFYRAERWPYRLERYLPGPLARRLHAEFARFDGPALDPARVETAGMAEWLERVARRAGLRRIADHIDDWGNRRFARALAGSIARHDPGVLWGYNGSVLPVFADPANAGRLRVLDRTTGDWRAYNAQMAAIRDRYRAFFRPGDLGVPQAAIDRDDAEYEAADIVLTGSRYAAHSVAAHARDASVAGKVRVLHYGVDEALFGALPPPRPRARGVPVRFLLLGQAHVRKGIHLVLDAFARIPASAATLSVVGELQIPPATFARYAGRVAWRPTVARAAVPALLQDTDVLLFPSYHEGGGIVLYEALAAGCALIQSRHAALAATPATGIVLDALTEEGVHAAAMALIDDPDRLAACRAAAPAEAQRYSFARYRDAIAALLDDIPMLDRPGA